MQVYTRMGECSDGNYKSFNGFTDLPSCLHKCLTEGDCLYVSFMDDQKDGQACKGYRYTKCTLKFKKRGRAWDVASKRHITYQKIQKGKSCFFVILTFIFILHAVDFHFVQHTVQKHLYFFSFVHFKYSCFLKRNRWNTTNVERHFLLKLTKKVYKIDKNTNSCCC